MKKLFYTLLVINSLISLPLFTQERNTESLSILQHLIENNIAFDSIAPMDSVISWGQQVSPILEKENRTELFFRIKQLVIYLHSLRGDIGPAIDEARLMYEKAEKMNFNLGIALSSVAIGDAYYCSNMPKEAVDSYKEAIRYPVTPSYNDYYKEITISKIISILLREGDISEAELYRNMLSTYPAIHTNKTLKLYSLANDVSYYIRKNEPEKSHDALLELEQIYNSDKQPYFRYFYYHMQGQYDEATGQYDTALEYYDRILQSIPDKTTSVSYLQVAYNKAGLLIKMNRKEEAAHLFEEINMITDSVVTPSYTHRINKLRASYQESRMKVENNAEFNRILLGGILIGIIILSAIIYLALHVRKQNKKIAESKIRLEQSRKNAENAMQTKSLFLSNMSHEIRTPLSALSGFSGLLTDENLDEETRRQCGDIIQQNSDLLLKLINDVIDLSNLDTGNMAFNFGYFNIIAICNNVIDTVNKIKQTQAEIRFTTTLDSLQLYTDDSRLQQLLINLLINATKFTPQGSITLEVEKQSDNSALFSVTDTGCGIPPDKQKNIFNRFEKLNEGAQGTGLGLSICQLIVERIGGEIWIDSNYTTGCRFCFTHPIHPIEHTKKQQA